MLSTALRYLLDLDIYNIIKKICINIKIESIFNCIYLYSVDLLQHWLLNELYVQLRTWYWYKNTFVLFHISKIYHTLYKPSETIFLFPSIIFFFFISLHPVYLVFFVSFSLLESFCFAFCLFPCYYYYLMHHSLHLL